MNVPRVSCVGEGGCGRRCKTHASLAWPHSTLHPEQGIWNGGALSSLSRFGRHGLRAIIDLEQRV